MKSGTSLDYESKKSYSITIWVSDLKGEDGYLDGSSIRICDSTLVVDDTIDVTINVTDVAEPPPAPAAPTLSKLTDDASKLNVTWTPPNMSGKPAITDYDVRYRKSGFSDWTALDAATSTATSTTLTGLRGQTTYQAQVRATNVEGTSDWSDTGSGKTAGNHDPAFSGEPPTISIAENSAGGKRRRHGGGQRW